MAENLTLGLAFLAGLVSFVSPCVLPLVPAYVGYMGGQVTSQVAAAVSGSSAAGAGRNRFGTFLHGVFFVLGFTFVFVVFGMLITAGSVVFDIGEVITRLGGLLIIVFAFHVMGYTPRFIRWIIGRKEQMNGGAGYIAALLVEALFAVALVWGLVTPALQLVGLGAYGLWLFLGGALVRPGDFWARTLTRVQTWLYADTRQQMQRGGEGYAGSAMMGMVFSAGWTPCIGPVYGAILTLSASGENLGQAGALLLVYSLGLGVPFLLTALALDQMQGALRRLQRHMHKIELVSGALLLLIGVLVLTGQLQQISQFGANGEFAYNLEYCTTELFQGRLALGDFGACMEQGPSFGAENADEAALPDTGNEGAGENVTPLDESAAQGGVLGELSALDSVSPSGETASTGANLPDVGLGVGFLAPPFETTTLLGQTVTLEDFRGSVAILNFWATWCGPCRVEMPFIQAAYEEHADEGLVVLAVNQGETSGVIDEFVSEFGLTFDVLLDPTGAIARDYQIQSLPTTYVLDHRGVIVARHFGVMTAEQLDSYLADAFAATP